MQSRKAVLVGDSGVGKTCLLLTFTTNCFPCDYVPSVFDNYSANVMFEMQPYNLSLFDTAGAEDVDRLRLYQYPGSHVVVICYGLDNRNSYNSVEERWIPEIRNSLSDVPLILLGTKLDAIEKNINAHDIVYVDGCVLASRIGAEEFIVCSSKTHKGIKALFNTIIKISNSKNKAKTSYCSLL